MTIHQTVDLFMDLADDQQPTLLGQASSQPSPRLGVRARISLVEAQLPALALRLGCLDPELRWFVGDQYAGADKALFGFLADASPDRWGRRLMDRRRAQERRLGLSQAPARLTAWDYLLGVDDRFRAGSLRLRAADGTWLTPPGSQDTPPLVSLRALEAAARTVEEDPDGLIDDRVRMLLAPGSSLGGARPKASVVDTHGRLWIAKFPSIGDRHDVGLWEMLTNAMAHQCGITVAEMIAVRLGQQHHTVRSRRFDRTDDGSRVHIASAMTLTGNTDGAGAADGVGYLDLAEVITRYGASPERCLPELWRRIVFNMLVSNADDHLRNHALLLEPGRGWRLAPAYDMNPVPEASALTLLVSAQENAMDLDLASSVADHFRVRPTAARTIIADMRRIVAQWRAAARGVGVSQAGCDRMARAFRLATTPS